MCKKVFLDHFQTIGKVKSDRKDTAFEIINFIRSHKIWHNIQNMKFEKVQQIFLKFNNVLPKSIQGDEVRQNLSKRRSLVLSVIKRG